MRPARSRNDSAVRDQSEPRGARFSLSPSEGERAGMRGRFVPGENSAFDCMVAARRPEGRNRPGAPSPFDRPQAVSRQETQPVE